MKMWLESGRMVEQMHRVVPLKDNHFRELLNVQGRLKVPKGP